MTDFKSQLPQLEKLFCDASLPNSQVLRSHAMEILISFSDTPEFLKTIKDHKDILKTAIAETGNPALNYKPLIFLVNLSSDEEVCGVLQSLSIVGALYRAIMVAMKKIDESHLQVTQSLLELAESNAEEPDKVSDHDVKKYALSNTTVSLDTKQLILDLESIKLAIMALINLAALSAPARKDIIQKGSVYEANNLMVVLDWVENPKTFLLFAQFLNVLISLSSDEESQGVLIDKCLGKFCAILKQRILAQDFASVNEMGKLLRNLSFNENNLKFAQGLLAGGFVSESVKLFAANPTNESVVIFSRFFVDVVLGLLTSDKATNDPEKFRPFYETPGLADALALVKPQEQSQKYYQDRIEALEHVLSSWH